MLNSLSPRSFAGRNCRDALGAAVRILITALNEMAGETWSRPQTGCCLPGCRPWSWFVSRDCAAGVWDERTYETNCCFLGDVQSRHVGAVFSLPLKRDSIIKRSRRSLNKAAAISTKLLDELRLTPRVVFPGPPTRLKKTPQRRHVSTVGVWDSVSIPCPFTC